MSNPTAVQPGERFAGAVRHAAQVHRDQVRKGTSIPYLSHPLAVASLVLEDGGGEDEAIAGLLHDCAEDGALGVAGELQRIREQFGEAVADLVRACTDVGEDASEDRGAANWRERKQHTIDDLERMGAPTLRVATADKLHNARSILTDLHEHGPVLWERFNAGREDQLWYYGALADRLAALQPSSRSAAELFRTVSAIRAVAEQRRG